MKICFKEFTRSTKSRRELVNITDQTSSFVQECNVETGICVVSSPHVTVAVVVNEAEQGAMQDILNKVQEEFPKGAGWLHDRVDDNGDAHLASTFLGNAKTFPVREGRLYLGTWQSIFLLELDGPRTRRVTCVVIGER